MDDQLKKEEFAPTRRELMAGGIGVAALFALGGASKAFALPAAQIVPPGGQSDLFWEACIRCDRCRSVCPTNAIGVAKIEQGLIAARTPKMEFRIGFCNECEGSYRCIEVCPTGALKQFNPRTQKIAMAEIDEQKCETYGISAACNKECIAVCSAEALDLDENGQLRLDEDACWGCGACEYACPANSFRAFDGSTSRGINVVAWEGSLK